MADTLLTDLTELSSLATGDKVHIVDISDTTDDAAGSSFWFTLTTLAAFTETLTNKTIDGDNNTITNIVLGAEASGASTALTDTADITYNADTDVSGNGWVIDEDAMGSDSATKVPTQQSVKAYVDTNAAATDGWIDKSSETWTRTGDHVFTVPTDLTATYQKGTKIRYKQGGSYEYGYVKSSAFASVTTVTLVTNADYAAAASSFTNQSVSYQENPQAFPEWFAFTTTFTGFSADPSTTAIYFKLSGMKCSFYYVDGSDGTSDAVTLTFTLPVAARRAHNNLGAVFVKDNGSMQAQPGHLTLGAASSTSSAYKSWSQGGFTGSGAKNIFTGVIEYEWS